MSLLLAELRKCQGSPGLQRPLRGTGAASWAEIKRPLFIVLQADLELGNGIVDRPDRIHPVSTEVMSGVVQVFAGSAKRFDSVMNLGMALGCGGSRHCGFRLWRRRSRWNRQRKRERANQRYDRYRA
jgi:hypothetical protein